MSGTSEVPPIVADSGRGAGERRRRPRAASGRTKSGIEVSAAVTAPPSCPDSQAMRASPLTCTPCAVSVNGGHLGGVGVEDQVGGGRRGAAGRATSATVDSARPSRIASSRVPPSSKLACTGPPTSSSDAETSMPDCRAARTAAPDVADLDHQRAAERRRRRGDHVGPARACPRPAPCRASGDRGRRPSGRPAAPRPSARPRAMRSRRASGLLRPCGADLAAVRRGRRASA